MIRKGAVLVLFVLLAADAYAQSPGGVSGNLRWWLKANAGTFTDNGTTPAADGSLVQQWNDQSTVGNNARQTTGANKPVYRTGIINGNPVLRFSSDQFLDGLAAPGISSNESMNIIMVFMQNSYVAGGTSDGGGTYIIDRPTATNNLASFKMVNTDKYFYQKRNDAGGSLTGPVSVTSAVTGRFLVVDYFRNFNTNYGIYLNGRLDATSGGDNEALTAPIVRIGRHATITGGGLNGDFAEMIVYDANLSATDRLKIQSYLALKYGITLDQTTATNYLNSSGTVIYPATTTHDSYDLNIAGIGRDDVSALNQSGSQSQNSQSIVRIFSPSSLDNGDFLIWGNDAPIIWNSSDVPAPYPNRISRIWRAAETGEVGTFSISFDLTGLGIDMSDPTKFALLVDNNGVFTDASVHTTGRSIAGNVVSFTGAGINNNEYFSLACPLIPGPGGVAATTVWIRADEEVYNNAGTTLATNGQTVQQWKTAGGVTAATASQNTAGSRPTFVTAAANNNPVVRFSGTKFMDFGSLGLANTADISMTMAFKPNTITTGAINDAAGMYILDRTSATNAVVSLKFVAGPKIGFQERLDAGGALSGISTTSNATTTMQIVDAYRDYAVRFGIFYNGAQEATLTEAGGALTFPTQRIGVTAAGTGAFDGDIAEYVLYNRDITTAERNRLDSYLAIKYGVTLNQVTLTNYTASDGVVIYPATSSHSGYVSDIAGIGKDAVSRLTQTSSKSVNANAVVTVSNPSSLDDLDFFVWGDNAGSMTSPTSTGVDGTVIKRRLSRVWRVAERNDVGTINIAFDLTNVPGTKNQADLRLMIDRDGDGFGDNDVTPVTGTLASNVFTVTGINLQNNDYLTIGTTNTTSTPLPIQLLSFDVNIEKDGVLAYWTTASEINNDYFTLERSFDGEEFDDVMRIPGAGTSNVSHYYEEMDYPRAVGDVYYRLKQTDLDGKTSRSAIRKVTLTTSPFFVKVHPNPVDRDEVTIELPAENYAAAIEMMNSAGQVVYSGTTNSGSNILNVSQLPKGMYFIRVLSNAGTLTSKLVIQ